MATTIGAAPRTLAGNPRRRQKERAVYLVFLVAALTSIAVTVFIIETLVGDAVGFLRKVSWDQLTADRFNPIANPPAPYGVKPLVYGSFVVTGIAMLVAGPIGLGAAIYLSEYASPSVRKVLKPILEVLAGIPSIVLGFFALRVLTPELVQPIFSEARGFNLLAAGLGVGILTIPLVASVSEDAMRAVPRSLREASYGLGAHRMTTSVRVVLPAAISGIVAAFILAISRAIGETMVVALAAGGSTNAVYDGVTGPGQTFAGEIVSLAYGGDESPADPAAKQSLYFLGFLLFLFTMTLNLIGDRFVRRVRQRY
jgi:phosphate transport system permease protein